MNVGHGSSPLNPEIALQQTAAERTGSAMTDPSAMNSFPQDSGERTAADGAIALVSGTKGVPIVATVGLSESETNHIARMGFPDYRGARAIEVGFAGDLVAPGGEEPVRSGLVMPLLDEEGPQSLLGVLTRDRETCQYCSVQPGRSHLTVDHVLPRSRGGLTTWENVVTACRDCNHRKGGRTPEEANMLLLSKPRQPQYVAFALLGELERHDVWRKYAYTTI